MKKVPPELIQKKLGRCKCGNRLTKGPGLEDNLCHSCNKLRYKAENKQKEDESEQ